MPQEILVPEQLAFMVPLELTRLQGDEGHEVERVEYGVTYITSGYVKMRSGDEPYLYIPPEVLEEAVPLFDRLGTFIDHANLAQMFYPSLQNAAGVTFKPTWNAGNKSIDGGWRLTNRPDLEWFRFFLNEFWEDQQAGREVPDIGLSAVIFPNFKWVEIVDDELGEVVKRERHMTKIKRAESVDCVFGPGAEGRLREVLTMLNSTQYLVGGLNPAGGNQMSNENGAATPEAGDAQAPESVTATQQQEVNGNGATPVALGSQAQPAPNGSTGSPQGDNGNGRFKQLMAAMEAQNARIDQLTQALSDREDDEVVEGMGHAPRGEGPRIWGMYTSLDQIELAYEQLMGLPVDRSKVHQLTGIKELYLMLTGDRQMRGEFNPDLVPTFLAYSSSGNNADTSTMAELTRNVMNKVLIQQADLLEDYNWWRTIAKIENLQSLQQVSWVRYGGIGYDTGDGLPTVAEKGEYQQLLWEDDRTTADWVKKGGYLPLSLEMIDRDDVMAWRDVPRQLAVASAVTISSVFSALFTDNSGAGADLSDSVGDGYAFNTTRGNLITQPLDFTNWNLAVDTMYKLAQLKNSTQTNDVRIAARPKYALVPIELEGQAVSEITSEFKPGESNRERVSVKRRLPEDNIIAVPHWTNQDNWAALADPMLIPFCGVAFRFGDQPEIFMPAQGNHIIWLHDVLPIKARWFFAVSVIDTRGAIKSNVS